MQVTAGRVDNKAYKIEQAKKPEETEKLCVTRDGLYVSSNRKKPRDSFLVPFEGDAQLIYVCGSELQPAAATGRLHEDS